MKTSEFMDKQIMELSRSQSYNFLDIANPHDREQEDDDEDYGAFPSFILGAPMDPIDFAEARGDAGMVAAIERTIKEHCENLLHAVEGISARLSQLESRTRQLENSVLDLKESVEFNHGRTYGKLGELENTLKEVQGGIQDIRDKQEIAEAQMELAQLHLSKVDLKFGNPNSTGQTNLSQKPLSSVPQQPSPVQQQFCQPPQLPAFPYNVHPNLPHQNPPPAATATAPLLPSQLQQNIIPSIPQPEIYFSPPVSTPETTHQRYHSLPTQQSQPPTPEQQTYQPAPQLPPVSQLPQLPQLHPVPQHYQPAPQLPLVSQLPQLPQQHPPVSTVNPQDHRPLNRQPEEVPYMPSQSSALGIHQSSQPPSRAPPPQQFYAGSAPQTYYEPSSWPHSEVSSGHLQPPEHSSFNDLHGYGGYSHYSSPSQFSLPPSVPRGGSSYSQLPTARILPHALPTASSVDAGSDSGGTKSRVIDDVVDKVVAMGFRRDLVSATVKKLTENGQSVDLNAVLDKLMNNGDVHTFGR